MDLDLLVHWKLQAFLCGKGTYQLLRCFVSYAAIHEELCPHKKFSETDIARASFHADSTITLLIPSPWN